MGISRRLKRASKEKSGYMVAALEVLRLFVPLATKHGLRLELHAGPPVEIIAVDSAGALRCCGCGDELTDHVSHSTVFGDMKAKATILVRTICATCVPAAQRSS